jgi:hypothetical protein
MMKKILFSLGLLVSTACFAQQKLTNQVLYGKWIVYAMMYDGTFHNFETDSTGYTDLARKTMKTPKDSIKLAAQNEIFFEIIKGSGFIFGGNGVYFEVDQQKNMQKGTYAINETTGIISTVLNKRPNQLQAGFANNILSLRDLKNRRQITYFCKKAKQ